MPDKQSPRNTNDAAVLRTPFPSRSTEPSSGSMSDELADAYLEAMIQNIRRLEEEPKGTR